MLLNDNEYLKIVEQIKGEIAKAQYKATLSFDRELILLYYNIGKVINENKIWGNKFIDNLAKISDFPTPTAPVIPSEI